MLVVGLGNPGEKYKLNRHNIGFLICDYILKNNSFSNLTKSSFEGELYKSNELFILKPQTYMNLSGKSVLA
ncbi:MAG: aminoacyl-tRNA hydrolase, partial [Campylobacterales bacterium]|nr:aminoacyl-tRNA hydrolase [Campylobacterales bacterium]